MINIVFKQKEDYIVAFNINGHSGYAEEGYDIICSAVSALSQSVVIGIEEVLNIKVNYHMDNGFLSLSMEDSSLEDIKNCQVLLKTMLKSFQSMKLAYGDYINVKIEEV